METTAIPTIKKTADKTLYMREYMRQYYTKDPEKAKAYRNTCRYRRTYDISPEEIEKYGVHLANIAKIKKTMAKVPEEFLKEIFNNYLGKTEE